MADNVEAILLRLGLDASGFTQGARNARKELGLMEKGVGSLKGELTSLAAGLAAGIGIAALAREALQFAESVTKVHDQTGLAVDSIQYLRLAADLTGVSIDSLAGLVNKMQRQLVEASGNKKVAEQFKDIGLEIADLRKMRPEDQLQAIAKAIAEIQDPAEQSAAAVLAFGKSGAEALPELKALASQQTELQDAFTRTGGAVSGETIAAVESLGDSFGELKTSVVALATELLGGAAPALKSFLETVTEVVGGLRLLDGEGDNALVNLDSKILRLQDSVDAFKKNNPFPDEWGKQYLAGLEKDLAAVRAQYNAMAGLGQEGADKQKADRLAQGLAIEKALSDGTLAEVQVRVKHETDAHFQMEAELIAHNERKLGIIAEANATILEQDAAFREKLAENANLGEIAQQDVVGGGLSKMEQFRAESWDRQVGIVAGGLVEMTQGIAQHSKAAFEINKVAGIAMAIVNTARGVSGVLADYPGPVGWALAAVQLAAGLAQVNAIKSTSFNGGGSGTAPSQAATAPVPVAAQGQQQGGGGGVLRVEGLSPDSVLSGASAQALAQKLLDYQKDGGQVVFQP